LIFLCFLLAAQTQQTRGNTTQPTEQSRRKKRKMQLVPISHTQISEDNPAEALKTRKAKGTVCPKEKPPTGEHKNL
jgi:hypothetical protein